jgi:hypothetical protein
MPGNHRAKAIASPPHKALGGEPGNRERCFSVSEAQKRRKIEKKSASRPERERENRRRDNANSKREKNFHKLSKIEFQFVKILLPIIISISDTLSSEWIRIRLAWVEDEEAATRLVRVTTTNPMNSQFLPAYVVSVTLAAFSNHHEVVMSPT